MKLTIYYDNGTSYTVNNVTEYSVDPDRNIYYIKDLPETNTALQCCGYMSKTGDVAAVRAVTQTASGPYTEFSIFNPSNFCLKTEVKRISAQ